MNLFFYFLKLLNKLFNPSAYEPLLKYKPQVLRLLSRIFGRNTRTALAILLLLVIIGYGIYRLQQEETPIAAAPPAKEAAGITWKGADNRIINIGKIASTYYVSGGALTADSSMVRFITHNNSTQDGYHMLFVPKGYIYKLILPDSTVVELNADSWICIPADYGCLKRELFFEGEAFFDIAPDARRLLTIHSGPVDVLALGTSVNINNYDGNNIQVALVEGSVIVSTTDRKKQLKAGEAATIEKHTSLMAIDTFSLTHTLGWRQGRYDAQGKTMKEIAAVMERWYNIKVVFDNPDLANQVLSGALFRNQPPEKYLKNFKDLGFLDYYMDDESTLHLK
jgi:hypothetical protein